jgi:alanine racemase
MNNTDSGRCWAEISLAALRHNAGVARKLAGADAALMAVIKANGYGHGLAAVAQALKDDAQLFGVANVKEALEARAVVPHPIVIMGPALPSERADIARHGFIPSVSSAEEALAFSRVAQGAGVALNCKIDTGMGRMGIIESDALEAIKGIAALPKVSIHSISTHLPSADDDPEYTREQLARFAALLASIRREVPGAYAVHALPSAGVIQFSESSYNIVRAGLMLYGVSPVREQQHLLQPAMTLKARVALVRSLPAGSSISYGRTFVTTRLSRMATLSIGYADDLPRAVSGRDAAVLIRGRRCPVAGRITMDLTIVDVTDVPGVKPGDEAVVIGRQGEEEITAFEVADRAATIPWEIFTRIGSRVARVYV